MLVGLEREDELFSAVHLLSENLLKVFVASIVVGIVVAVLNQLLVRSDRPDQAMLVSLAGLITTMMLLVREISSLFDLIKSLFGF